MDLKLLHQFKRSLFIGFSFLFPFTVCLVRFYKNRVQYLIYLSVITKVIERLLVS